MFDCGVAASVKLVEIWNFLKVKWEGIKWLPQNFHLAFMISMNSNSFHHKTLEGRWYDFFHLIKWKRVFENIWISFGNISNSETLCNSMIFMREDKMTSSNAKKESWKFQRIKLKVPLKLFWNPLSVWSYLFFIQIIFL